LKKIKLKKLELISILLGVVLVVSILNTFMVLGLGQQIASLDGTGTGNLAGNSAGGTGKLKETAPLGGTNGGDTGPAGEVNLTDDDAFLGPADAKVTVVEFSDFECPYCAAAMDLHEGLISQFKARDPSWEAAVPKLKELALQGKIKFVYRDFPLSIHRNAQKAAEAAECAKEQGKFWEMHDSLFEISGSLSVTAMKQIAKDIGLNSAEFDDCLDSGAMVPEVQKDLADGTSLGVSGTPAFFVNGTLVSGAQPFSAFEQVINAELAKVGG
jgi:protein-disulfide isomerase